MFWSKEFWPPNSPDLNPLDYYVWSVVEKVTNKSRHPSVTSLRTAIETTFVSMDNATLKCACELFRLLHDYLNGNNKIKVNSISFTNIFVSFISIYDAILVTRKQNKIFPKETCINTQAEPA